MKIVHIIPTYNEKENIERMVSVLTEVAKKTPGYTHAILFVDDFSPDGSGELVKQIQKKNDNVYLLEKKKEGLGRALIMGYDYAIKKLHADIVIPNDADFQWDPEDIPKLIKKIDEGYDVVVASRHVAGGKVVGWNWFRNLNHEFSNSLLAWWIAGVKEVHDHAGNFKAIRVKGVLDKVPLRKMQNAGFSFQLHILYELSKTGAKFVEVPVIFHERRFGKSKIGFNRYYVRDVFEYLKSSVLIRYDRSASFFKYCVVGGIGFLVQTIISHFLILTGIKPGISVAVGAEASIISNFLFNNFWTFKHVKIEEGKLLKKFVHFNGISLGAILIQSVAVTIGTHFFGTGTWFIFMVLSIVCIVIPYSYVMYSLFIWKTKKV